MSNFSNRIIKAMEEIITAKVNLDEKIDMNSESPDTSENPDEKTKSRKSSPYIMPEIDDTNIAKKKSKSATIHELETAWKKNKASDDPEEIVMENIEMTKASIKSIVYHANALEAGLNDSNQSCLSEGWIQSKITIIEDYLKAVHDYIMYYEEEDSEEDSYASQQKFDGKKRSDLKDSDFLFPSTKSFPIVTPQDVRHAISNFGRMKSDMSYNSFLKKLYNFCKKKGPEFVAALPKASKEKLDIENK